jgi:hypothetical protein
MAVSVSTANQNSIPFALHISRENMSQSHDFSLREIDLEKGTKIDCEENQTKKKRKSAGYGMGYQQSHHSNSPKQCNTNESLAALNKHAKYGERAQRVNGNVSIHGVEKLLDIADRIPFVGVKNTSVKVMFFFV